MSFYKNTFGRIQYNSPVVLTFAFISLIVLLLQGLIGNSITLTLFTVYRSSYLDPLFYIRIFGHVLGHADWSHFFSNFLIILLIGPMLEEKYGSRNIFFMILFCALFTGILNIIFFETALLGASGIVFMMILLGSYANFQEGKIPLTLLLVLAVFLGKEIMSGLFEKDNISQFTHIAGGAFGGFFGYRLNRQ